MSRRRGGKPLHAIPPWGAESWTGGATARSRSAQGRPARRFGDSPWRAASHHPRSAGEARARGRVEEGECRHESGGEGERRPRLPWRGLVMAGGRGPKVWPGTPVRIGREGEEENHARRAPTGGAGGAGRRPGEPASPWTGSSDPFAPEGRREEGMRRRGRKTMHEEPPRGGSRWGRPKAGGSSLSLDRIQ